MAIIGQTLPSPEQGWQRYDDVDNHFKYSESARRITASASSFYNGTVMIWDVVGVNTVKFIAYCSKLRIIAQPYITRSNSVEVEIDGNVVGTYSLKSPSGVNQCLVYEETGLSLGYHSVTLTDKATGDFIFDAVDIDSDGYMLFLAGDTMLNSNITETYNQDIDIVGSFEFFGEEVSNIRYRYLVNGVAQPWSAFGSYTTFNISVPYTSLEYGVNKIKLEVETVEEKTSFAFINVTRLITELLQPQYVYFDKVTLDWLPILSPEKISSLYLKKTGSQNIYITGESYNDTSLISSTTYTYKIAGISNSIEIESNPINITTPSDAAFYYVWENGAYVLKEIEGLAFEDANGDYYTAPNGIKIKPLDIGNLVGGRQSNVFGFEISNTYENENFNVELKVSRNNTLAEDMGDYGLLYDAVDERHRTEVTFSLDSVTYTPNYPLITYLGAGQKKTVYMKLKPSILTNGQETIQVLMTGRRS